MFGNNRIEEARKYAVEQLLEVAHTLDGEEAPRGDERTKLLFERTLLTGMADMAAYLGVKNRSLSDLARLITRERIGYATGRIETGILHIQPVGLDFSQAEIVKPPDGHEGDI